MENNTTDIQEQDPGTKEPVTVSDAIGQEVQQSDIPVTDITDQEKNVVREWYEANHGPVNEFIFHDHNRYDIIIHAMGGDNVFFTIPDATGNDVKYVSSNDKLIEKVIVLEQKELIGQGKALPVTVVTFGPGQLKIYALPGTL